MVVVILIIAFPVIFDCFLPGLTWPTWTTTKNTDNILHKTQYKIERKVQTNATGEEGGGNVKLTGGGGFTPAT